MLARRAEQGLGLRIPEGGEETYKPGQKGELSQPWGSEDVREQFYQREQHELRLQERPGLLKKLMWLEAGK